MQKDGFSPLRNPGNGIFIEQGANDNTIGGTTGAAPNTIAFNGFSGITVWDGARNSIRGNSIHDNTVLGIDLGHDGITLNDLLDFDPGPNGLQNFPNLAWANLGTLEIAGYLDARPSTRYTIDFYRSPQCGTFRYGEGRWYLDSTTVTTDGLGAAIFFTKAGSLGSGEFITATATDPDGNTSEFSACVPVTADSDDDGVGDDVEDKGPHGGDGNQDGVPDSQQLDVATVFDLATGLYTTLVAGAGAALEAVKAGPNPASATAPPGIKFDLGFFGFTIKLPAGQTSTTVTLIPKLAVTINDYWQYGPTPDNPVPHWYRFLFDGTTGAEIVAGAVNQVVLHFVDGLRGDHDLAANGEIVDPGGPAAPIAAGLRITGSARPLPAFVGQTFGYSFTVTNHSPDTASDVFFTDTLSRGVHFVSSSTSSGATLTESGGTVAGNLGPLSSEQRVDVTITTLLTDPGEIRNTATVSGNVTELDPSDNSVTLVTQVSPPPMTIAPETDLAVTLAATPDSVGVGGDLTYTLTVTNRGPDAANNVVLTDNLPADVRLVSVSGTRTLPPPVNAPLRIRFDYSYDTGYFDPVTETFFPPFFDTEEKRDLLELAAEFLLSGVRDDLDAIVSGGENTWVATFRNPVTGVEERLADLAVAENELVVFVGGRDLGASGPGLAEGGVAAAGGFAASGTAEFVSTVETRGERGARADARTDFGPWGGSIAFNTNPAVQYHFGETIDGLDADELDFVSVAMHELAHVLGVGTSPSWQHYVDAIGGTFFGPASQAEYDLGGPIPLDAARQHWLDGTQDGGQATLMDPVASLGVRELPTPLDMAALRDVGWGDEPRSMSVPIPYTHSGGVLTFEVGALDADTSVTVTVAVTPTQAGTAVNSVSVTGDGTDANASDNTAQVTTQVDPCPPLVVNTIWDGDDGISDGRVTTLREAIRLANLLAGKDTISFNIPGPGPHATVVGWALPTITDPVVIDGTTQPGYAGTPVIHLLGSSRVAVPNGLHITAGDSTVRGLKINSFYATFPSITVGNGILLENGGGNVIEGNHLGSDHQFLRGNDTAGIAVVNSDGNTIGGTTPQARNVIAGNYNHGILLYESSDNVIEGNYVGTDATGQTAVGNGIGITLILSDHNRIGGTMLGAGNLISGNREVGVKLGWDAILTYAYDNQVQGNFIGVAADGTSPLGNGSHGVFITSGGRNIVGGREAGAGNTIAFNGGAGVLLSADLRTLIVENSIHSNGGLAIDRYPPGVTPNDPGGLDGVPDFPSLDYALSDAATTRIRGTMRGRPSKSFELDFYSTAATDPSGHGEGQEWLGTTTVTTNNLGVASFYVSFATSVPPGRFVAATSTTEASTSEFSNSVVVAADGDRDGVADAEENGGPNTGDSDRDGAADSGQANVTTLRNVGDQQYVTFQSPVGTRWDGLRAIANPSPGNSPYAMPFPIAFLDGAVKGVGTGGSTTVTLLLPAGVIPNSFYQFGPTATQTSDHWYEFLFDGTSGAEILPDRVVLHLVDGGRGDHDLTADGRITLLGGVSGPPAMHVVDVSPPPNTNQAPLTPAIWATFGDDLDPATVSRETFVVHGSQSGQLLDSPGMLPGQSATAGVQPSRPFFPGELVQVTTTTGVRSTGGESPLSSFGWQFRAAVGGGTGVFAEGDPQFGGQSLFTGAFADLDTDGDLDIFFGSTEGRVWLNDGQGQFSDSGQRLGRGNAVLGDVDGDGDLDTLLVGSLEYDIGVWINDGRGYFTDIGEHYQLFPTLKDFVRLGDVDGDGDLDFVVGGSDLYRTTTEIWLNDGQGRFSRSGLPLGSGQDGTIDIALGDLDGDGDLDAYLVGGNNARVWLNNGRGDFNDSGQRLGQFAGKVMLDDLDGDGDLDAFIGASLGSFEVWLNDGQGHFTDSGQRLRIEYP